MMLAGGSGVTCFWRGCQRRFERKSTRKRFCSDQCRTNHHTRKNYRKKNPIVVAEKKCKGCPRKFEVDSRTLGPKKDYCSHNCKSRHGMRVLREKRKTEKKPLVLHDVISDGVTVWVNGAYGCLARFGLNGIDIHHDISPTSKKILENTECLFCTHTPVTKEDWTTFVTKTKELHGIKVSARYMPKRFR